MSALLLHHGIVHSPTDPYATALIVDAGSLAWLGGDDTAAVFLRDGMAEQDLGGAVVTPLFMDPLASGAGGAAGRGIGLVTVLQGWGGDRSTRPTAVSDETDRQAPAVVRYRSLQAAEEQNSAGLWLPADTLAPAELEQALTAAVEAGEQVYLVPADLADPSGVTAAQAAALEALEAIERRCGTAALGRLRPRLVVGGPLTAEETDLLARIAASATVVVDAEGRAGAPVATLLNGAVPVCLSLAGAANPWAAVRALLHHQDPEQSVSARSAFTAATRTGLRALPDTPAAQVPLPARLTVSAPASFAVWDADAVMVQAPDGRVAAWSTDTRAGTPLLPSLDPGEPLPRLRSTWLDGKQITVSASA